VRGWRALVRGIHALRHRATTDREVADEVQHYLEQATAAHIARGVAPADALRAARMEIGNVTTLREQVRGGGWENVVDTVLTDLGYAARRLRAARGFTTITLLTLALGIGATTAIYSVVKPILFDPLPYPDADRIAMIREGRPDGSYNEGTFGMYRELVARSRSFDAIAVLRSWQPTLTGSDHPERLDAQRVSASYFTVLGVKPALGRGFLPSDDVAGGPGIVVLSDALWQRRFGGDRAILGSEITLDDRRYTVIGIMPPDFENVLAPSAGVWAPLQYEMSQPRAWGHHLRTIGRLKPGIDVAAATREVSVLGQAVVTELHPETYGPQVSLLATSLHDDLTGAVEPALLAILGAVALVLLIACVNVTNMLLARGVHRRGEFALRAALGAAHGRLVRQLLTESLLLAALGGAAGMAASFGFIRALVALSPPGLPRIGAIRLDGGALAFGLAITTLIGLAFGVIPALQAARSDPNRDLQRGSHRTTGGHRRVRDGLVIAEVALALVLLVSSGLLLRSLDRLFAIPAGFDASRLLTVQVQTSGARFDDDRTTDRFFELALDAVRNIPGVTAAAFTSQLPLSGDLDEYGVRLEGSAEGNSTLRYAVSPGYIETMGIPLRRGRPFDERDVAEAPPVALINESFATVLFAGADPIGQRVQIGPTDGPFYTVVGIVGDVKQMSLASSRTDAVYTTAGQWRFADKAMSLVVRTRGDAASLAPAVREAIWSVDRDQPIVRVATMDDLLAATAADRRFALILFQGFALAALVLAAAGIFGVLSGSVAERTREIGVRSALGASRGSIVGLVLRQGLLLTAFGIAIGVAGSVAATDAIAAMLFGVSRLDPMTYLAVIALLGVVSVIACSVPAWRAARVDPASTLRAE
jgi:putative ABC transport system permease protein